jgi:hydrogenase expression/formation protein HypC
MQVVEARGFHALCRGRGGEELVNMMLVGPQPAGSWILNFLGSAREVLSEEDARNADRALDALAAVMAGAETIDYDHYFPGIDGGEDRGEPGWREAGSDHL